MFLVESNEVRLALDAWKSLFTQNSVQRFLDMHHDLPTNIMSQEDELKCIKYAISCSNWASICICITGGAQIFL